VTGGVVTSEPHVLSVYHPVLSVARGRVFSSALAQRVDVEPMFSGELRITSASGIGD
jgi:hypothetical protein